MSARLVRTSGFVGMVAFATWLTACEQVEQVVDAYRDLTPHEAYLVALEEAGLGTTALADAWKTSAQAAVDRPQEVTLPFQEQGFIAQEEAGAVGYRFGVQRGQILTMMFEVDSSEDTEVFLDLFRIPADEEDPLRPAQVDSVEGGFTFEPPRSGEYVVRLQPELLRGGQYRLTMTLDAALEFPVADHGTRNIQSVFGDVRDGGRRNHHGVDIFAARGTPVVAAVAGTISRANLTGLGGKVVWLNDGRRNWSLYYAHLDSQAVRAGDRVQIGDTLGFVGNTGNARTTPPHLHFGVYSRGPTDPMPFLRTPPGTLAELVVETDVLGEWGRAINTGIRLRTHPNRRASVVTELGLHTPFRVLGGSGEWYRVRLPDGEQGWIAARLTEALENPVDSRVAGGDELLLFSPDAAAAVMARIEPGTDLPVLGAYLGFQLVESPAGARGWITSDQ